MCKNCLLDPKMDFIFKRIFGSEQDTDVLIKFLNAILESNDTTGNYDPIVWVEIQNPEITKSDIKDKYSVLDIKAKTSRGEIIDIEMQRKDDTHMLKRSLFYVNKIYTDQIDSGDDYSKLNRVVSIIIMNYSAKFIKNENFHNTYRFKNVASNEELTDLQELHYIELPKMEFKDENDLLQLFLQFLIDPYDEIVEKKSTQIQELSKAKQKLTRLSRDPKTRAEYDAREKSLKDKVSALSKAKSEGLVEGLATGRAEGLVKGENNKTIELAIKFLDIADDETIAEKTGLDISKVKKLREENS